MSEFNPRQPYLIEFRNPKEGDLYVRRDEAETNVSTLDMTGDAIFPVLVPHGEPLPDPLPEIADCVCGAGCGLERLDDLRYLQCRSATSPFCGYIGPNFPSDLEAIKAHNAMMKVLKENA